MKNKNENPIDGLFRRKLNEEQLAPDDLLWNEIETKLETKKPSRRFGLWFLLGALLLCGVVSYFEFFNHSSINSTIVSEKVAPIENKISGNKTPVNSTSSSPSTSTNSVPTNNSTTAKSTSNSANKNSSIEKSNSSVGNQTTFSKNSSSGIKTTVVKNSSSGNLPASNKNGVETIVKKSSNEIKNIENSSITNSNSLNDSKTEIDNSQKEISGTQSNLKNETGNSVSDNSSINSENNSENTLTTESQNTNTTNNEITASTENKTLLDTTAIVNQKIIFAPPPLIAEKVKRWFVEVGCSYMNNKSKLSVSSSSTNQIQSQIDSVYYAIRNSNEKSAATFNYNINIGVKVKNFQFKSGIDVMRFGENIQYDNHGLCFTVEGNPTLGYDTLQVHMQVNNTIGSRNGKSVNTYLGIPLQVNYSIPLKILKLQFGIGGFASTPLKWNSYYLNKTVTGLENPYALKMINSIVLGYSFQAGVAVPVTKHFDTVLNYDFRQTMSPIEKTEYGTKKVFKSSGANLSLRYNF